MSLEGSGDVPLTPSTFVFLTASRTFVLTGHLHLTDVHVLHGLAVPKASGTLPEYARSVLRR